MKDLIKSLIGSRLARFNLHRNDAIGALYRAWLYVYASEMRGDYYEFGVHQGNSLAHSYRAYYYCSTQYRKNKVPPQAIDVRKNYFDFQPDFYAFDTFEGMPENNEGQFVHAGSFMTSVPIVKEMCRKAGLEGNKLQIRKGLFSDYFNQFQGGQKTPACIIHIDCDLYGSALDALKISKSLMQQGTVLLMDDYNLFAASNRAGERRALREFMQAHQIEFEPWFAYGPASQAFFCHL